MSCFFVQFLFKTIYFFIGLRSGKNYITKRDWTHCAICCAMLRNTNTNLLRPWKIVLSQIDLCDLLNVNLHLQCLLTSCPWSQPDDNHYIQYTITQHNCHLHSLAHEHLNSPATDLHDCSDSVHHYNTISTRFFWLTWYLGRKWADGWCSH